MNAPRKKVLEDGTVIIEKPDGLLVRVLPSGDVILTNLDGSSVTTQPDGFVIQRDAAGREIARTRAKSRTPPEEREFNVATMNVDPLARKMSNLAPRPFVLDGVHFASVEAFYRWLQWSMDPAKQQEMPPLTGAEARAAGRGCPHAEAVFAAKASSWARPGIMPSSKKQSGRVCGRTRTSPRSLPKRIRDPSSTIPAGPKA
jgi:hypothetical protein